MSIDDLLREREVLLCCGAGGVGKTTVAAALAVRAATQCGRRAIVVTIDPARRLAQALGLEGVGDRATSVPIGDGSGSLDAMMLDPEASWRRLILDLSPDADTADALLSNGVYRAVTDRFIQSHDYLAMARLAALSEDDRYDLVIVDTPPSRHAVDFLDAPAAMRDFFSSALLKWMTSTGARTTTGLAAQTFRRVAGRVLGRTFVEDIAEFFVLLSHLGDGFVAAADVVETSLVAPSTGTIVVATEDAHPALEAEHFASVLNKRTMRLDAIVVNRVVASELTGRDVEALANQWAAAEPTTPIAQVERDAAEVFHDLTWRDAAGTAALERIAVAHPAVPHFDIEQMSTAPVTVDALGDVGARMRISDRTGSASS